MQYTSKFALLAVALFSASALALPFGTEAEYDLEAREIDNDLSAREFYDMYLEAREDPSLDARDLETLDFQARDYLDYLEAREADAVAPLTPHALSTDKTSSVDSHKHALTENDEKPKKKEHKHKHGLRAAIHHRREKKAERAKVYLNDPKNFEKALERPGHKYHKQAVKKLKALLKKSQHTKSDTTSAATKET